MENRRVTDPLLRAKEQQARDEKYRPRAALKIKAQFKNQGNTELLPASLPAAGGAAATSKWNGGLIRSTMMEMSSSLNTPQNTILVDAYAELQKSFASETISGESSLSAAFICGSDVQVTHIGSTRLILLTTDNDQHYSATRLTFDHLYAKMDEEEQKYFDKKRLGNYNEATEYQPHHSGFHDFTRLLGRKNIVQEPNHFSFTLPEESGETYLIAVTSELTHLMQERNIAECINSNLIALNSSENKAQAIADFLTIETQQRDTKTAAAVLVIKVSNNKQNLPTLCYITEGKGSLELAEHINTTFKEQVMNKFTNQISLEKAAEGEKEVRVSATPFNFLQNFNPQKPTQTAEEESPEKEQTATARPQPAKLPGGSAPTSCRIC